jgi:hypothetical protein
MCACVYTPCVYTPCVYTLFVCVCVCTHTHTHTHIHAHTRTLTHSRTHTHTHTQVLDSFFLAELVYNFFAGTHIDSVYAKTKLNTKLNTKPSLSTISSLARTLIACTQTPN